MKATIDDELKKRGVVDHVFHETSALTGQNLDEFKTLFGMCFYGTCMHLRIRRYSLQLFTICIVIALLWHHDLSSDTLLYSYAFVTKHHLCML